MVGIDRNCPKYAVVNGSLNDIPIMQDFLGMVHEDRQVVYVSGMTVFPVNAVVPEQLVGMVQSLNVPIVLTEGPSEGYYTIDMDGTQSDFVPIIPQPEQFDGDERMEEEDNDDNRAPVVDDRLNVLDHSASVDDDGEADLEEEIRRQQRYYEAVYNENPNTSETILVGGESEIQTFDTVEELELENQLALQQIEELKLSLRDDDEDNVAAVENSVIEEVEESDVAVVSEGETISVPEGTSGSVASTSSVQNLINRFESGQVEVEESLSIRLSRLGQRRSSPTGDVNVRKRVRMMERLIDKE
ncbi:hypothetical protein BD770DRAFT_449402 [Pilaira anomala]|nr:hypothetical protein BD770DRAFT_449402 [Pilaira anomala]